MKKIFTLSLVVICTLMFTISCKTRTRVITPDPGTDDIINKDNNGGSVINDSNGTLNLVLYVKKDGIERKVDTIKESGYTYEVIPQESSDSKCNKIEKKHETSFSKTSEEDRIELSSISLNKNCQRGYTINIQLLCKFDKAPQSCYEGQIELSFGDLNSGAKTVIEQLKVKETTTDIEINPDIK